MIIAQLLDASTARLNLSSATRRLFTQDGDEVRKSALVFLSILCFYTYHKRLLACSEEKMILFISLNHMQFKKKLLRLHILASPLSLSLSLFLAHPRREFREDNWALPTKLSFVTHLVTGKFFLWFQITNFAEIERDQYVCVSCGEGFLRARGETRMFQS